MGMTSQMASSRMMSFEASVSGRHDGTLEAAYIRIKAGAVARTVEIEPDVLLCDYDRRGNILGFEILAPIKLSTLIKQAPIPIRTPFRRFVSHSVPEELVVA